MSSTLKKIDIPLTTSKLTVAIVQIEGPLPAGKHLSLVAKNRETYTWRSTDEIARRIAKARQVLERLHEEHPGIHIVIFPEYSLPLFPNTVAELQALSTRHKRIIIPGADNLLQRGSQHIYTQCPVLIPARDEPVWFTKSGLSDWEKGFVDEKPRDISHLLRWRSQGKTYWLTIKICFDLLLAVKDPASEEKDPGLFFVPLATPDIITFRAYADILLRSRAGRAVFLCNAIGKNTVGGSSVITTIRGANVLEPAVSLTAHRESIAIVELDCSQLSPPRKTSIPATSSLGRRTYYDIDSTAAVLNLVPAATEPPQPSPRAILNPSLFVLSGKKMRLAFLTINNFPELETRARGQKFEILAILGQHDVLVSHVDQTRKSTRIDDDSG